MFICILYDLCLIISRKRIKKDKMVYLFDVRNCAKTMLRKIYNST